MTNEKLYRFIHWAYHKLMVVEQVGLENIPRTGGVLLATNHMSRLDAPLLFINTVRKDVTALVADKYQKYPFFRWILNMAEVIWIDRSKADFSAFKAAIDYLRKGGILGIAPEGTRSKEGALIEAKTGVALLADKAGVPVIPVGISGTEGALRKIFTLRKPHVQAAYGKPIHLPPIRREFREEDLQRNTDEIMCQIAALLPAPYRGYYANHPRLQQILAGAG